jgi:hypothetical protein
MPNDEAEIMNELTQRIPEFQLNRLDPGQVFDLN